MKTIRGVCWAIVLALTAAAPVAAQQRHRPGSQIDGEQDHRMMAEGACAMAMMSTDAAAMDPQVASPAAVAPRARLHRPQRATGPSRIRTGTHAANPVADLPHAYRNRVRLATGPTRVPPAIVGWHAASPADETPAASRPRARRATGPSRIPE